MVKSESVLLLVPLAEPLAVAEVFSRVDPPPRVPLTEFGESFRTNGLNAVHPSRLPLHYAAVVDVRPERVR